MKPTIPISEYTYALPDDRIAGFPLEKRDESKLLEYRQGQILHHRFYDLPALLPTDSILFFNDTRVIPARLLLQKETGAVIEIFLLNPADPATLVQNTMQQKAGARWKCTIGNLKRWNDDQVLTKKLRTGELTMRLESRGEGIVSFTWTPSDLTFADVINQLGTTPLPPYIKRKAEANDQLRYQTVYSHYEGAVAAPTAGLHFTDDVLNKIKGRNIETGFLTLHVSAGTFQPVKTDDAREHVMHAEQVIVTAKNVDQVLKGKRVVAIGTTAMRTLESLFWFGVKLLKDPNAEFIIRQDDPYQQTTVIPSLTESLGAVKMYMQKNRLEQLVGKTSIYILPGYTFRVCRGLVTNFHQPGSTLMLLVAAFVGSDWKRIYQTALDSDYRFLSFGDSSLLLP